MRETKMTTTNLCILLTKDDELGQWVSHCLDLDIVSQGETVATSIESIIEAVRLCIDEDQAQGLHPLSRPAAPQECWDLFLANPKDVPRRTRTFTILVELEKYLINKKDIIGTHETCLDLPIRYVLHTAPDPFKVSIFCDKWQDGEVSKVDRLPVATWLPERGLSMVSFTFSLLRDAGLVEHVTEFCEQAYAAYEDS